jgi:hypothetical protein
VTTLASALLLIQWPPSSALLDLKPLHPLDWALIGAVTLGLAILTRSLRPRLAD